MQKRIEAGNFLRAVRRAPLTGLLSLGIFGLPGVARATTPQTTIQPSLGINMNVETTGIFEDIGQIQMFAGSVTPGGFVPANGQTLGIGANAVLYNSLGSTYGGDGTTTFALPNLNGQAIIGTGQGIGLTPRTLGTAIGAKSVTLFAANAPPALGGGDLPFNNIQPSMPLNYYICTTGVFPQANVIGAGGQTTPFLGQIIATASPEAVPTTYTALDGQLLSITQNNALFNLIGTTFGGNGATTFQLPDLRGRTPIGVGTGVGLTQRNLADVVGAESTTLSTNNYPAPTGTSAPYSNMQPSLALHYMIAIAGIFPQAAVNEASANSPIIGTISLFAGSFAPGGWMFCDGQVLPINAANSTLFDVLGASFGGDGVSTFALPDLDGRTAVGQDGADWLLGTQAGVESLPTNVSELPLVPTPEPESIALLAIGFSLLARRRVSA